MNIKKYGSFSGRLFNVFNYALMTVFMIACLYPFYYVIIYSLSDPHKISRGGVFFWPVNPTIDSYVEILSKKTVPLAFVVSAAKTVLGTALCIYCSSLFGYLMTKQEMRFRKLVYRFVISSMYLGAGLIPWYLTMKAYGLQNSFLLYVIPGMLNAFFVILIKTYIESIPASMEESAEVDGAGFLTMFHRIIFPLSKPIIATVAVFSAVGIWNSWQDNFFLVSNPNLQTIQLILYKYFNEATLLAAELARNPSAIKEAPKISSETVKMTMSVISIVPILLVYPFMQRYFVKGIMLGAVKG
ncbi:carbohydrate ABC transporter permease [Paenibacillus sp. GCM10027626]|uniref:carbohydrate ABC transporter permease n=1 Tax=Paenibacillus sp. GCM10027626 TaxID=3273411 RepID=UPI0036255235